MFCAATVLVALARILSACAIRAPAFFSALARSRRRRRSSVSRCSRYGFQPRLYMSTTARLASRYQTLLTTASSSVDVVGDHDQAALVAGEEAAQPGDRVGVEVVGRLVEQQDAAAGLAGVAEQDAGQLDAAALAAGEGADGLGEHPVGQARGWRRSGPPRPRPRTRRARRTGPPGAPYRRISLSVGVARRAWPRASSSRPAARPGRGRRAPGRGR